MKRLLVTLVSGLVAAAAASAAPAPDEVVKTAVERVQTLISKNHAQYKADSAAFYKVVDTEIVPHFDVRQISQLVLGKNWKTANEEQRTRFGNAFKDMLIRSYANAMLEYHDSVKPEWKPLRMAPDAKDAVVKSNLLRPNKPPVAIDFRMRLTEGGWKIYDIAVEDISLITNFRGQISGEIKRSSLDDVIKRMESGTYAADPKASGAQQG